MNDITYSVDPTTGNLIKSTVVDTSDIDNQISDLQTKLSAANITIENCTGQINDANAVVADLTPKLQALVDQKSALVTEQATVQASLAQAASAAQAAQPVTP